MKRSRVAHIVVCSQDDLSPYIDKIINRMKDLIESMPFNWSENDVVCPKLNQFCWTFHNIEKPHYHFFFNFNRTLDLYQIDLIFRIFLILINDIESFCGLKFSSVDYEPTSLNFDDCILYCKY